jgi:folate-dependent phosphoribosylglycinamide formyltransferase PurN
MPPRKMFDPAIRPKPMRIACFMSGSGTNVTKILENQLRKAENCPYKVVLIFTDVFDPSNQRCRAQSIASTHHINYEHNDIAEFYRSQGRGNRKDISLRPEYDKITAETIEKYDLDLIALCGYMSIVTRPLIERYNDRIVNVHPADLSVRQGDRRKYTGLNAVRDAILSGEKKLYSTTHIVREKVDYGEILMRSKAIEVILPEGITLNKLRDPQNAHILKKIASDHQDRLKEQGDWVIYPKTLEMIGEGRYAVDGHGNVYADNVPVPNGIRL